MTQQHRGSRLGAWAALLAVPVMHLAGCSRPDPCERLFEMQVKCSWCKQDPDKATFVRECAKTFTPLIDCAERSDCDTFKDCLATNLQKNASLAAAWRRLLLDCGLDTEAGEAPQK